MRSLYLVLAFCISGFSEEASTINSILDRKVESFEVSGSLKMVLEKLREKSYSQESKPSQLNIVYISLIEEHDSIDGLESFPDSEVDPFNELKRVPTSKEFKFHFKQKTFREILVQVCAKWNLRYVFDDYAVTLSQPTRESEEEYPKFYSLSDIGLD